MRRRDLYIRMTICHFLTNLVVDATCHELCERTYERNLSCYGETCRCTYHVCLSDAALNESFRKVSDKSFHLEGTEKVGCHGNDVRVPLACLVKSGSEAASCIYFT